MANIKLSNIQSIYYYIMPIEYKLHYFLHISFIWNEEFNLDFVLISKNDLHELNNEKALSSILFDRVGFS